MISEGVQRRLSLSLDLILNLIEERGHIKRLTCDLGEDSGQFLANVYEEYSDKISEKVSLFNQNVEKVKLLNNDIISAVNEWYAFVKDDKALQSPLFPIKLHLKRKHIRLRIKELKQEITSIAIKTRLIKEDIIRLEGTLEYEAAQRLKKDVRYDDYLHHLKTKSQLIDELKYLLPSIPELPFNCLAIDSLEETAAWIKSELQPE